MGKVKKGKKNPTARDSDVKTTNIVTIKPAQKGKKLSIIHVEELPQGVGLETPLHPRKRRRVWQPTDQDALGQPNAPLISPPQKPSLPEAMSKADCPPEAMSKADCPPEAMSKADCPPLVEPELHSGGAMRRPLRQRLSDGQTDALNYGSDPSSGESDNEEALSVLILPRTLTSLMDTPMDDESATSAIILPDASTTQVDLMATDQPRSFCDFNWEEFPSVPIPPESRRESFSNINVGPTSPCVDPYEIFVAIWDRQIMEHIASETNRYAQQIAHQMILDNTLQPNSRISRWRDTTADELYVYFAIILAMGVVVKSRLNEYWSASHDIFCTPGFKVHMSTNRFKLLNRCLHFNNNEDMCTLEPSVSEAKLFKITPLLTHLNMKFQTMYRLAQNISLDESLLMWKGGLDINQLIPDKAATVGTKTYELCESQTGYLWRFEVHAHKSSPPQQLEDPLNASTPAIVLRLLNGLEYKGHTVWMDNFYNSPLLARRLKTLGIDCAGTLRTTRKFVPQALNSLTKENMRAGQVSGLTSGDVDVMVWRDNNRVATISTYHGNAVTEDRGSIKPIIILDYNIMMGGVDKKDQMLAMYPIERKQTKVWYKKLFRRLLNVSVLNSFIIHKKSSPTPSLDHRNFRISLINSLLSKHHRPTSSALPSSPFSLPSTSSFSRPLAVVEVDLTHRPEPYPFHDGARQRRRCVICKKRTQTFCTGCKKTVCLYTCFLVLHPSAKL